MKARNHKVPQKKSKQYNKEIKATILFLGVQGLLIHLLQWQCFSLNTFFLEPGQTLTVHLWS